MLRRQYKFYEYHSLCQLRPDTRPQLLLASLSICSTLLEILPNVARLCGCCSSGLYLQPLFIRDYFISERALPMLMKFESLPHIAQKPMTQKCQRLQYHSCVYCTQETQEDSLEGSGDTRRPLYSLQASPNVAATDL